MDEHAICRLARRYPTLDMQCLQILVMVSEFSGLSVSDIAEELGTPHHHIQFHVSMLAGGKKGREQHGLNLLLIENDLLDKRRKVLGLTQSGERVIKAIKPLLK